MVFSKRASFMLAFFLTANAWGDTVQLNPAHPDSYTVVEHDTLWDIAGRFLQHPSQWPTLWRSNQQIINPNLIYPGDTIHLRLVNGQPQMELVRNSNNARLRYSGTVNNGTCVFDETDGVSRIDVNRNQNGKVFPCIRESDVQKAIDMIPLDRIAAFLRSPKVVAVNELNSSPYIVSFAGDHILAGAGDKVYVRAILDKDTPSYTVYRAGNPYVSPETGEILGYEAEHIADAVLQEVGDPATLIIEKNKREILTGDRLMPQASEGVTLTYFPQPPKQTVQGNILSIMGGVNQIGKYDVVVIDKGQRDGLIVGHELTISQRGKLVRDDHSGINDNMIRMPDEVAGTLMVFRPFEKVSYALVMKATQPIHVLDKVSSP